MSDDVVIDAGDAQFDEPISPELALVCEELAAFARSRLPDHPPFPAVATRPLVSPTSAEDSRAANGIPAVGAFAGLVQNPTPWQLETDDRGAVDDHPHSALAYIPSPPRLLITCVATVTAIALFAAGFVIGERRRQTERAVVSTSGAGAETSRRESSRARQARAARSAPDAGAARQPERPRPPTGMSSASGIVGRSTQRGAGGAPTADLRSARTAPRLLPASGFVWDSGSHFQISADARRIVDFEAHTACGRVTVPAIVITPKGTFRFRGTVGSARGPVTAEIAGQFMSRESARGTIRYRAAGCNSAPINFVARLS